jgi:hypothetical protein
MRAPQLNGERSLQGAAVAKASLKSFLLISLVSARFALMKSFRERFFVLRCTEMVLSIGAFQQVFEPIDQ